MQRLPLLVAALVMLACGGTSGSTGGPAKSSPSAAPTAQASPSLTPALLDKIGIESVGRRLYVGAHPSGCHLADRPSFCPVTDRLALQMVAIGQAMQQSGSPGPLDLFCRCQNAPTTSLAVVGEPISDSLGIAHVELFGDTSSPIRVDYLVVVGPHGSLLADDQWCAGRDHSAGSGSTSVYNTAGRLAACGPQGGWLN